MWMRQMTLGQIDLEGNGFHEALNAFIIFHTMESPGKLKSMDAAILFLKARTWREIKKLTVVSEHIAVNLALTTSTVLLHSCLCVTSQYQSLFASPCTATSLLHTAFPKYHVHFYKATQAIIWNKQKWIMNILMIVDTSLEQCSQYCASITSLMKNEDVHCEKPLSLRCQSQMNIHPADEPCSPWDCATK